MGIELYEMLEQEEALRKAAEELARLQGDTGAAADAAAGINAQVDEANQKAKAAEIAFRNLNNELRKLASRIRDLESELEEEKGARAAGKEKLTALRAQVQQITAERDEL